MVLKQNASATSWRGAGPSPGMPAASVSPGSFGIFSALMSLSSLRHRESVRLPSNDFL